MQCTYIGKFTVEHTQFKKRRMVGSEINKALESVVDNGISCESYREMEARRLMKIG